MKTINKLNYEAYYLDFLEGNLDDKLVHELKMFLDKNPVLKIDDELAILDETDISLNDEIKQRLKQYDETSDITPASVEDFIIAKNEGLLDQEKEAELKSSQHFNQQLDNLYQKLKFTHNPKEKYIYKNSLKKKETKITPLFWWSVAASILFFIAFNIPWNNTEVDTKNTYSSEILTDNDSISQQPAPQTTNTFVIENKKAQTAAIANSTVTQKTMLPKKQKQKENVNEPAENFENREKIADKPLPSPVMDNSPFEITPIAKNTFSKTETAINEEDLASVSSKKMVNPIQPITNFIQEKTNIEIEYLHSKKNKDSKRSFKLKIGKFSIARNRK